MKTERRAALLALAALRGEGSSSVLAEAIKEYLVNEKTRTQRRKELLSLGGSLSVNEAEALRKIAVSLRRP